MTSEELEALEKLEKAATPGDWKKGGWDMSIESASGEEVCDSCSCCGGCSGDNAENDMPLILALRNAAPALIAAARENARLRAVVEAAEVIATTHAPLPGSSVLRTVRIDQLGALSAALSALDAKETP